MIMASIDERTFRFYLLFLEKEDSLCGLATSDLPECTGNERWCVLTTSS